MIKLFKMTVTAPGFAEATNGASREGNELTLAKSELAHITLRALRSAAPLKLAQSVLRRDEQRLSPRSSERGPVEASISRQGKEGAGLSPRSSERGPVEARTLR